MFNRTDTLVWIQKYITSEVTLLGYYGVDLNAMYDCRYPSDIRVYKRMSDTELLTHSKILSTYLISKQITDNIINRLIKG